MSVLERPCIRQEQPHYAAPATVSMDKVPAMQAVNPATRDFLAWVARRPRTYAETMAAWQTTCPRHSVWEDALGDVLIQLDRDDRLASAQTTVTLTLKGRAVLG
jgi:hypothetical protein